MTHHYLPFLAKMGGIYAASALTGWLFAFIHIPLPWMIGPLVLSAGLSIYGFEIAAPRLTRHAGQIVVAGSVGLAFTPATLAVLIDNLMPMAVAAVFTLVAGFTIAGLMRRMTGMDPVSASLCCVPLGPIESAYLAEQYKVPSGPVVFVQTLRIAATVMLIPPILVWSSGADDLVRGLSGLGWTYPGMAMTVGASTLGVIVCHVLRVSNPVFLGALAGASLAMLLSLPVTALPYALVAAGQVLLGVSLGAGFKRELFLGARKFIPAAMISTFLLLVSCATVGTAISYAADLGWAAMVLATAPGSVTEMALTAKILGASPALVTSFHIVRIFLLIPFAPLIFKAVGRLTGWHGREP